MAFRMSYIAVEAYRGFRRNLLLALSMVIIVAISLTLFGVALLAGRQISLYGGYWYSKTEISVFLSDGLTEAQRQEIHDKLAAIPVVQNVFYESKLQAYQHFKDYFASTPDFVNNVSPNALPASFRVKLKDPSQSAQVHDAFCNGTFDSRGHENCQVGIDKVIDQRRLLKRLFEMLNMVKIFFAVMAGVLGVAATVLIAVTVRVAAFARRKETQIMKLVGASNTYIRLPFLAEGVFAGVLGALVAFAFLRIVMFYPDRVRDQVAFVSQLPLIGMRDFYTACVILLAFGVTASGLASILALRRYVRV